MAKSKSITKYESYVRDVLLDYIVHGRKIGKIVQLHTDWLKESKENSSYRYIFDEGEALGAIEAIESFKIFEGDYAGQNLVLEPFQAFIVAMIFGWIKKENGLRRFKDIFIMMGKGNGKSPLMAAIALLILLKDKGAQVYSAANDREQSKIIFNWMKGFISYSEELQSLLDVYHSSIIYKPTLSRYKPLSKIAKTTSGFNPSCIIVDEVAMLPDAQLFNQLSASMFKRKESLFLQITHAGFWKASPGFIKYQYAEKVLEGIVVDDQFLPIIYEIDEDDDWKDHKIIKKANPASFLNIEDLEKRIEYAKNSPSEEREIRTMNLNQWLLGQADMWIPLRVWENAITNEEKYKEYISEEKLKTYPCAMGLDLAKRYDFTATAIAFYIKELNMFYLKHRYYIPREQIEEKIKTDSELVWKWIEDGNIVATEGPTIDNRRVADDIIQDVETYHPIQVNYDPALSSDIQSMLESVIDIVPIQQKALVMSSPTYDLDVYIQNRQIIDANPVMQWNVLNSKVERWNNLIKLIKATKDSPERIDGVIASIMALMPLKEMMLLKRPEKEVTYDIEWI